jgi:uncharacterized protein (TIGR03437 family)
MALAAALLSLSALAQTKSSYDAVKDFALSTNPNGQWSYLYDNALMKMSINATASTGQVAWQAEVLDGYAIQVGTILGSSPFDFNLGNGDEYDFPTDHLYLSPWLGNVAVRFTAPSSGQYTVTGDFLGIETQQASHPVEILVNGSSVLMMTLSTFNQKLPFSFTQTVKAGDTIDFVNVGSSAQLGYLTGVTATIVPAGPPATLTNVISAGAFGGFSSIAPGSWVEIYGSNLASTTRSWAGSDFSGVNGVNAPTSLSGTTVTIGGLNAFIDYISPSQVNAQVPQNVPSGAQPVVVTTAAGAGTAYSINVKATEPGLLAPPSFLINGKQMIVALFADGVTYVLPPGAIPGVASQRATPGQTITIYGVGFGPVMPNIPAGQIVQQTNTLADPFQVSFGGSPAVLSYSGLAPGFVGLYQFNVVVPNVAASDTVPVTFTLSGTAGTQTLYIAVGN